MDRWVGSAAGQAGLPALGSGLIPLALRFEALYTLHPSAEAPKYDPIFITTGQVSCGRGGAGEESGYLAQGRWQAEAFMVAE